MHAVALAGLAAAAADAAATLKLKRPGAVAAFARGRHLGEQLADRREQAGVGGRVAARRAADGALVDVDDLVEVVQALQCVVRRGLGVAAVQLARPPRAYSVSLISVLLPEPRDAGHAGEQAHRESPRPRPCRLLPRAPSDAQRSGVAPARSAAAAAAPRCAARRAR
jgi:hypothetical protein